MPARTFPPSLPARVLSKPLLPPEIFAIIIDLAVTPLCPYKSGRSELLASLCTVNRDSYRLVTSRLYHTVILSSSNQVSGFLYTITVNAYLARCVVNLWIGDIGLKPSFKGYTDEACALALPAIPNLCRFAINGQDTSVKWATLACTHLTISDLPVLTHSTTTLRTLHLIDSLLSVDALQHSLSGCPTLHTVVFEFTQPIDIGTLLQLGVTVVKTVRYLRKLTFRIEDFWILHHTTRILSARLINEGLEEQVKGKSIGVVWSWELGMDLCEIWVANGCNRKIGKEHKLV
ncbi:hypothetical protein FS749_003274 [Ceratobasidium sp. UAMH 11750]|nr:hypothetical protein FS749_003274 [Ceratobasidium sp. UAMH 11750]